MCTACSLTSSGPASSWRSTRTSLCSTRRWPAPPGCPWILLEPAINESCSLVQDTTTGQILFRHNVGIPGDSKEMTWKWRPLYWYYRFIPLNDPEQLYFFSSQQCQRLGFRNIVIAERGFNYAFFLSNFGLEKIKLLLTILILVGFSWDFSEYLKFWGIDKYMSICGYGKKNCVEYRPLIVEESFTIKVRDTS